MQMFDCLKAGAPTPNVVQRSVIFHSLDNMLSQYSVPKFFDVTTFKRACILILLVIAQIKIDGIKRDNILKWGWKFLVV